MTKRKFTVVNTTDEKLVCIEVLPEQRASKLPVVILCHGFAYFKEEDGLFTEVSKRLADIGYAVYYFDFSGCGESEGDYTNTTLTKLIQDLRSVYATVIKYPYIDLNNVSLISQSFGSNVIIGAQMKNLQRMVLCGSFTNAYKVLSELFTDFNEKGISTRYSR